MVAPGTRKKASVVRLILLSHSRSRVLTPLGYDQTGPSSQVHSHTLSHTHAHSHTRPLPARLSSPHPGRIYPPPAFALLSPSLFFPPTSTSSSSRPPLVAIFRLAIRLPPERCLYKHPFCALCCHCCLLSTVSPLAQKFIRSNHHPLLLVPWFAPLCDRLLFAVTIYPTAHRAFVGPIKSPNPQRPKRLRDPSRAVSARYDLRCAAITTFDPTARHSIRPGAFHFPHYFCDASSAPLLVSARLELAHTHPAAAISRTDSVPLQQESRRKLFVSSNISEASSARSSLPHR